MTDEARALLIVAALLFGAGCGVGGFAGRMTAPVQPAEVRYVTISAPPEVVKPYPAPEPPAAAVETKPPPKAEVKPKAPTKPQAKPRHMVQKKSLPSCAIVKREYEMMSLAQQMAAYRSATPEQIAHGRRCLGM